MPSTLAARIPPAKYSWKKLKSKAATVHITWHEYSNPIMSHVKMSGTINNDSTTFDTLLHFIMYLVIGHTCPYEIVSRHGVICELNCFCLLQVDSGRVVEHQWVEN